MKVAQAIIKQDLRVAPQEGAGLVLEKMEQSGHNALPVVEEGVYQGLLSIAKLRAIEDGAQVLSDTGVSLQQVYIFEDQHLFDALPLFASHGINVLPVISGEHHYVGMVDAASLIAAVNEMLDCERPGSVLVLELGQRDNALSHIAHIVESANAQILSSFTRYPPDSSRMEITLKINTSTLSDVVASLLRYDYQVKTTYSLEMDREDINARFEHLMNYINM